MVILDSAPAAIRTTHTRARKGVWDENPFELRSPKRTRRSSKDRK
jgi:hypothetical protein